MVEEARQVVKDGPGTSKALLTIVLILLMVVSGFVGAFSANGGNSIHAAPLTASDAGAVAKGSVDPGATQRSGIVVTNASVLSGQGINSTGAFFPYMGGADGGYAFASYPSMVNASYPVIFPYASPVASFPPAEYTGVYDNINTFVQPYNYEGTSQYDNQFATGLHWVANFTRIYPPMVYGNYSGGPHGVPGYSLQFNVPFFSTMPNGQENVGWYQNTFGFNTMQGNGNPQASNASYFISTSNEWWLNYTSPDYVIPYSYNQSPYNSVFVNPQNPLIFSSWVNISYAGGFNTAQGQVFISAADKVTGLLAEATDPSSYVPYAKYSYRSVWYNFTFQIVNGSKDGVFPFPVFLTNGYVFGRVGYSGIAFAGFGNGQVVWGNYTATFGVAQDVLGNMEPVSAILAQQSSTGEGDQGTEGVVIVDSPTNPLGLPAYFPYTYVSNQSGSPLTSSPAYNLQHDAVGSTLIMGNVFPANATVTAYATITHSYIHVVKNGSAFYVDYPGLLGVGTEFIETGLSLDYWSPIILNVSANGFHGSSVVITPYSEARPTVEMRLVWAVLAPLSQKMVYGFVNIPFSYLSYFMDRYISPNYPGINGLSGRIDGGTNVTQGEELLGDINHISENASSYFWLQVGGGQSSFNASGYLPSFFRMLLDSLWSPRTYGAEFSGVVGNIFNNSVMIPYYFLTSSAATSISINAPLVSGEVSIPSGVGAYEENISLSSFDVPVMLDIPSQPVAYGHAPPSISSVSVNGNTVWTGNSTDARISVDVPLSDIASSMDGGFILQMNYGMYHPGSYVSPLEPSLYYNMTITVTPSSQRYAPMTFYRDIMAFNYSLYTLALGTGADSANLSAVYPVTFQQVQIGVGGSYYAIVQGTVYGRYNVSEGRFVLGGASLVFTRNGMELTTATTSSDGHFSANLTLAPEGAWGFNRTIEVNVSVSDPQFTNHSTIMWVHEGDVYWLNSSLIFMNTISIGGYNITFPYWFFEDLGGFLVGITDIGIYMVMIYFGAIVGIGIGGAVGGGGIMYVIGKRMLKVGGSKATGAAKGVMQQIKPK